MPNSKQIVYLSQAQYAELIVNGSITVDGVTVTYDENDIYVTPQAEPVTDVKINNTSISSNGVANIPVASATKLGVMSTNNQYGIDMYGQHPCIKAAAEDKIKAGTDPWQPIVSDRLDYATFYGLAKAAGADMKNITPTTVGVYPDEQKGAIQDMLGISDLLAPIETDYLADKAYAVGDMFTNNGKLYKVISAISEGGAIVVQDDGETVSGANAIQCKLGEERVKDVQVNGTSVVTDGVANVPIAGTTDLGVARFRINTFNVQNGLVDIQFSGDNTVKAGTEIWKPLNPGKQHAAAFYGLAKAAGDTTQSASSNAVGTYTDNAKASIKAMLGIVDGSTSTVSVTGTTPSITAVENTRYTCGEVSTLTITPPASGICIVRFTSGTTPTVLTATGVTWPAWFDATDLDADTTYEICITDGYGAVMSWAL